MSDPVFSVVTPVYNTEAYLAECIESVLAQTRGDFEYLVQDNRSTDGSRAIAESYARHDPRIRVITNETFLGQVPNYNQALARIAPGTRYVKIVQADDRLFPACLAEMGALMDAHPSVGLVSAYDLVGTRVRGAALPLETPVLSGRDACRLFLLKDRFLFGSPTTVMYRADLVRSRVPFYAEGRYHEDSEAAFELLGGCDFGFVHQVLSFLRVRPESISGAVRGNDPEPLDRLILVTRFGPRDLSPEENAACLADARRDYYRHLGAAWLERREDAYWEYHRKGLATIGETIRRGALLRQAAIELAARATPCGLRGRAHRR